MSKHVRSSRASARSKLTKLNDDIPVHDDDVDCVLERCAGGDEKLTLDEVAAAVEYWFSDTRVFDQEQAEKRRACWDALCCRSKRVNP